jgi:hypothetical protein
MRFREFRIAADYAKTVSRETGQSHSVQREQSGWLVVRFVYSNKVKNVPRDDEDDGEEWERFDEACKPDDRWSEDENLRMEPDPYSDE